MLVTETLTFDEYWDDVRFTYKRPYMHGSMKQSFGDNIYHHVGNRWRQEDSHHSLESGAQNLRNIRNDTQTNRVLVSNDFVYYGGSGPLLPKRFRNFGGVDICGRRGHKNDFPEKMVTQFVVWVRSLEHIGYVSAPLDWPKSR
jgi:hypothetical protein